MCVGVSSGHECENLGKGGFTMRQPCMPVLPATRPSIVVWASLSFSVRGLSSTLPILSSFKSATAQTKSPSSNQAVSNVSSKARSWGLGVKIIG